MKARTFWIIFAISSIAWLILTLMLAPSMNGNDVFIFRDAGWNLASTGHFESAGLLYMRDLTPRLYAHYTPIFPLLFAGFLKLFPQNPYAGSVFNLLSGCFLAAVLLYIVLLQTPSKLRNLVAVIIALFPALFITYDRPETLGVAFFGITLFLTSREKFNVLSVSLLLALTFLTQPLIAIFATAWITIAIYLSNLDQPKSLRMTSFWIARITTLTGLIVASVALLFYSLDPESLKRFIGHALGFRSGLGVVTNNIYFLESLRIGIFGHGAPYAVFYLLTIIMNLLLILWLLSRRLNATLKDHILVLVTIFLTVITILLFPAQGRYVIALGFVIPLALLLIESKNVDLKQLSLVLLSAVIVAHLPEVVISYLQRAEQLPSFHAAESQPTTLLKRLPSPDAIIAVEGGSYDLYKPYFHHLIELDHADDVVDLSQIAGVANCYGGYDGDSIALHPLPRLLNPADFQLIERAPSHLWVTAWGHRVMDRQWGYGCDLYLRTNSSNSQPRAQDGLRQQAH